MRIAILSRSGALYSTRRIREAAEARGHQVAVIDALRCYMTIASHKPAIYYKGQNLTGFDAVIPRIGASITFYGTAVLRQFEMMGVFPVNESIAVVRARDKLRSLQLLARKGIGLPLTGFAHSPEDTEALVHQMGGSPVIIKLLEGTQGKGVMLAESLSAAESVVHTFAGLRVNVLVQEFIKEADNSDIRCFVVGGKVVASMKRQAKAGEFRSNLHCGGSGSAVKITSEERAVAVRAVQVLGLNVAGVDLLRSKQGPLVLEVNSSPGLKGIEEISGCDVADKIIEFVEQNLKQPYVPYGRK